jgi:WD40 repeat protein
LLANGKVLVAGGNDGYLLNLESFKSALLYSNGTWTATGNMTEIRSDLASVLLDNGNVLVAGGEDMDGVVLESSEIYNVATGTWSATEDMKDTRSNFRLIKLNNGKILAMAGMYDKTCDLYDQTTGKWTSTGEMKHSRSYMYGATKLQNGNVLVTGGGEEIAEIYNVATGTWSDVSNLMNSVRGNTASILMSNGKVLIVGGVDLTSEIFDISTNTFTKAGDLENYVNSCELINLNNGNVLVYGMGDIFSMDRKALQVFSTSSKKWNSAGPISPSVFPGYGYTVNRLQNGRILYAGGNYSTGNGANEYCYLVNESSIVSGIENQKINSGLSIYPNPSKGKVTIETEQNLAGIEYRILDLSGRIMLTDQFKENARTINLEQLEIGVYFLQIGNDVAHLSKIIIE